MKTLQKLPVTIIETDAALPLLTGRREITITGRRNIETLRHLLEAGRKGITSIDHWATGKRLSQYIMCLRRAGLNIETINERVGDVTYGRYKLISDVVIEDDGAPGARAA